MDPLFTSMQQQQQQLGRQFHDEFNDWQSGLTPTLDLFSPLPSQFSFPQSDASVVRRFLHDPHRPWASMAQPAATQVESLATQPFPMMVAYAHDVHYGMTSPSNSGPSSEDTHSGYNDEQSIAWSSPRPSPAELSPMRDVEPIPQFHGGGVAELDCPHGVSMHDVQGYPDEIPEQTFFDEGPFVHYNPVAEEGYQPRAFSDHKMDGPEMDTGTSNSTESGRQFPKMHRRRVSAAQSATSPTGSAKVTKRSSRRRRTSSSSSRSNSRLSSVVDSSTSNRAFPCLFVKYGCSSTFKTKNEWKRHVLTQHMRTGLWRCDECEASDDRKPNGFNRKDLFVQHIRRMHPLDISKPSSTKSSGPRSHKKDPEDQRLSDIAKRCYQTTRSLPDDCGCHFCDARFTGPNAWDERMEHVGGHMEATKKENEEAADPQTWLHDEALEDYLKREHIIEARGKRYVLAQGSR